jgi:hypothetical protein
VQSDGNEQGLKLVLVEFTPESSKSGMWSLQFLLTRHNHKKMECSTSMAGLAGLGKTS